MKQTNEKTWDEILFPTRECACGGTQRVVETSRVRGEYGVSITHEWLCDRCKKLFKP